MKAQRASACVELSTARARLQRVPKCYIRMDGYWHAPANIGRTRGCNVWSLPVWSGHALQTRASGGFLNTLRQFFIAPILFLNCQYPTSITFYNNATNG